LLDAQLNPQGFDSGSGMTIGVTAYEVWYYLGKASSRLSLPAAAWFFLKISAQACFFLLLGRKGAAADRSPLDTEMANDLIAFARLCHTTVIHRA
jgi:hypothetical protein